MTSGGDAAEQVVRLSLEGVEVAAKITGTGAKHIAILLAAVLKEEHKTQGKARLSSMIRSGKELKVFSIQNRDLKKFSQEAKRYGVLYCVLKDKDNQDELASIDIIARAEDASKIQRIMERFEMASISRASVISADVMEKEGKELNPYLVPEGRFQSGPKSKAVDRSEDSPKESVRDKLNMYKEKAKMKEQAERVKGVKRRPGLKKEVIRREAR